MRRFVLCSTGGVYGRRVVGKIDEQSPTQPWNAYESSKLASETVLREIASARGMEHVILRPAVVYGPRDARMRKLFRMVSGGRFPLFGRGAGRRHLVYVSDVVDAFMRACTAPSAANRDMIIAGAKRFRCGSSSTRSPRSRTFAVSAHNCLCGRCSRWPR